ncbi:MAG: uracil phosphoribosyltransferase [Candidatus Dormiibacterota bacterium]
MAEGLRVVNHPIVAHRLSQLRDRDTEPDHFRFLMGELTTFLAYEALSHLQTRSREVQTPVGRALGQEISEQLLVVPILRAGLGMVPGVQRVAPSCDVAHLGLKRDESTLTAVCYLDGLPADLEGRPVVICDPMLATGGSLIQACRLVRERGASELLAICLVASEEGFSRFSRELPEVPVFCAALDQELDHRGYIVPGLGDAGDRLFGPPGEGLSQRARSRSG